jgi:predicted nucleotidyltransferase
MDKMPSADEIKGKLASLFEEEGLQLVLLFGSAAARTVHRKSDIDLGFLFERPVDLLALTNRVIRLLHTDRVDVVDLKRAGPLLNFSVAKKNRLLYERTSGVYNEFCSLAFRRYVDSKKLRDRRAEVIQRFLEDRGLV